MIRKLVAAVCGLALVFGMMTTATAPAEAGRGGRTAAIVGGTILGLGLLGAYAHARDRSYYRGSCYEVGGGCYWKEGHCYVDRWGREVCRRGYKVCEPVRTVCD